MKKIARAFVALIALTATAQAKDWQIDPAHSTLGFTGEQSGEKFSGGFKKFAAQISLDPDHPETGKISVTVDLASATAGSADRDAMLPQKDWFDTSKFPQAVFATTKIDWGGNCDATDLNGHCGSYIATGTLTIKGITKNVTLPFRLLPEGDHWRAQGKTTLMRNDFAVGTGMFTGENYVKNAVDVTIDLAAKPQN